MASEVTKLITVSLGKIQQSRQARTGLNLRKSLLVASVLHKARDLYVAEIKNRRVDCAQQLRTMDIDESDHQSSIETSNQGIDTKQNSTESISSTVGAVVDNLVEGSKDPENRIQQTAEDDSHDENKENNAILDQSPVQELESSVTETSDSVELTNMDTGKVSKASCQRCLKRRADQDTLKTTNITLSTVTHSSKYGQDFNQKESHAELVPRKRLRIDSRFDFVGPQFTNCESRPHTLSTEPMSTESTQINNLVQIFNASFAGFASEPRPENIPYGTTEMNTFSLCREAIALTA